MSHVLVLVFGAGKGAQTDIIIVISDLHFEQNIAGSLVSPLISIWWIQVSSNLQTYDILKINLLNYSRLLTMPFLDSKILSGFVTGTVHTCCSNIPLPPRPDPSDFTSSPIAFLPRQGKPSASFSHLSELLLITCHVPSPCHRYFSPGTFCLIIYLRSNFKFVHMVI